MLFCALWLPHHRTSVAMGRRICLSTNYCLLWAEKLFLPMNRVKFLKPDRMDPLRVALFLHVIFCAPFGLTEHCTWRGKIRDGKCPSRALSGVGHLVALPIPRSLGVHCLLGLTYADRNVAHVFGYDRREIPSEPNSTKNLFIFPSLQEHCIQPGLSGNLILSTTPVSECGSVSFAGRCVMLCMGANTDRDSVIRIGSLRPRLGKL